MTTEKSRPESPSAARRRRPSADRAHERQSLQDLLDLTSYWYWERDHSYRLTRIVGRAFEAAGFDPADYLGRLPWDSGALPGKGGSWDRNRALLDGRQPFADLVFKRPNSAGEMRYVSSSGKPAFDAAGRFTGYRGIARDVTEQVQARLRLTVEHGVTHILAEATDIAEATPRIIRVICETLGWSCGARWAVEQDVSIRCAETWGLAEPDIDAFLAATRRHSSTPHPGGLIGRAWVSGEPVWICDVTADPTFLRAEPAQAAGLRSAFAFPIKVGGATVGVMEFFSRDVVPPDPALLEASAYIGTQVGQFIRSRRAEEEVRESQARFRAIVDSANEGILVYDRSLNVIGGNATAERILGLPLAEIIGAAGFTSLLPCVREDGSPLARDERPTRVTVHTGEPQTGRIIGIRRPDGSTTWLSVNTGFMRHAGDPEHHGVVSTLTDITERKRAELASLRIGRMYAALSATNDAILHAKTPEELYQRVCDAVVEGGQLSAAAILLFRSAPGRLETAAGAGDACDQSAGDGADAATAGRRLAEEACSTQRVCVTSALVPSWGTPARAAAALPLRCGGSCVGAVLLQHQEQGAFDDDNIRLLERLAQNVSFALENFERDREREQAQQRIQYLATHDSLTGLPNRMMFAQLLGAAFRSAQRYRRPFAVLFLDLDRFKVINDTLGHDAGDALLTAMAARLRQCLRASDTVARLGGDEFVVLLQETAEREQVEAVARKLLAVVMQPLMVQGHECRVTVSIGISTYPGDARDEQALMKHADAAMYAAKEGGKNGFRFYSTRRRTQSLERLTLETGLRRALEREEFFLHYQPKASLASGAITGVEALLRWRHPDLGLVSPAEFIALAEETGLIVPIGRWVLRAACAQSRAWRRAGLPPLSLAVNLSPRQFGNERLLQDLDEAVRQGEMPVGLLELEITEHAVTVDVEHAARQLAAIRETGVRLAIDDFGTGYSSLAQLKRFPIDILKIDGSFIHGIPGAPENSAIAQAIIAMGRALNLTVVAEGVETEEQRQFLRAHGCDEIQGFQLSRPLAPDLLAEFLRAYIPTAGDRAEPGSAADERRTAP